MTLSPAAVSRPAVNYWIVAAVVVVPTFMEILDTTIANVALRYIAGRPVRRADRRRLGHHQLPGRQRHRPADHRLAVGAPRPPQLLSFVDRRLYPRLGTVRPGHQPVADDPLPGDPGAGRRRAPAVQPGSSAGRLPVREAGHGHDAVRGRRHHRPHRRPDVGRLALRQLRLALDLSRQRPDWALFPGCRVCRCRGSRLPQGGAGRAGPPATELRLHRPGAVGADDVLLGNHAQQGTGMGLAGRPVRAGADAADHCSCWGWGS